MISNEIGLRVDTPISDNDVPQTYTPLRKRRLVANKNIKMVPKKKTAKAKDTNEEDETCSATICKMLSGLVIYSMHFIFILHFYFHLNFSSDCTGFEWRLNQV
ncbi:hypothetical protein OUZ56_032789 [Daphnia magna]|uniref:Uncharacterized protein n=1 Tax=Daphnia magna TaxID=35525 RepID=A0ABQ9ZX49_9CRUS|nr:hypothetical protein OUZ56_032789 [Daphnia magna]